MTGDEMERAIEFILKNQAAFDAKFEAEREQTNQQIRELSARDQKTREFLDELTRIVAQNSQDITRNSQHIRHLSNMMENMAEGQNRRDEEIDALFKLVGGLIERENGKSES